MQSNLSRILLQSKIDGKLEEEASAEFEENLNNYEYLCLYGIAAGESRSEIGEQLGVSEMLVGLYLDNCVHKLGAKNVYHAVAKAFRYNILN